MLHPVGSWKCAELHTPFSDRYGWIKSTCLTKWLFALGVYKISWLFGKQQEKIGIGVQKEG